MSRTRRVFNLAAGALMLLYSYLLFLNPGEGLQVAAGILSISMIVFGLSMFHYYFTMARHMVGGKVALLLGVFELDLGMFTIALSDSPRINVVLFLLGYHAFSGLVNLLRGLEARRYRAWEWKPNVVHGAVDFTIALGCIFFIRSTRILVYAYCVTLAWSAVMRIVSALRKTSVIYIGP